MSSGEALHEVNTVFGRDEVPELAAAEGEGHVREALRHLLPAQPAHVPRRVPALQAARILAVPPPSKVQLSPSFIFYQEQRQDASLAD